MGSRLVVGLGSKVVMFMLLLGSNMGRFRLLGKLEELAAIFLVEFSEGQLELSSKHDWEGMEEGMVVAW